MENQIASNYLSSIQKQFHQYKKSAEGAMIQLEEKSLFIHANEDTNSIAVIVKHLHGNMLSRWTDFRTTDGEKEWRQRDVEFENDIQNRETVLKVWEEGWNCLFTALDSIKEDELLNKIYIRKEAHSIMEAINRQLTHYSYHVGQIVYICKMLKKEEWNSLTIPRKK